MKEINKNKKVTSKYVGKVPDIKNGFAYKFVISDNNTTEEIQFIYDGGTGSIYSRNMSNPNPKVELMWQDDILMCD